MIRRWYSKDWILVGLCLFLLLAVLFFDITKVRVKDDDFDSKIEAANLMKKCLKEIKNERLAKNIKINEEDINNTGIIGDEISGITTTLGSLEAKRTSTNPNFAAVVVDMLHEIGIKKGDVVAVNCSSSFPALNIAVMSAIEVLDAKPVVMLSLGSSTYGGNIPEFMYLDMEEMLYNKKIISNKAQVISFGGAKDIGMDFDQELIPTLKNKIKKFDRQFLYEENLELNLLKRTKIYYNNKKNDIRAFINVGGNIVSLGRDIGVLNYPHGIIKREKYTPKSVNQQGLIQIFLKEGVDVIQLLNIKKIACDYGIPIDPSPIPNIAEGDVYYKYTYNKVIIALVLCLSFGVILFYSRGTKKRG